MRIPSLFTRSAGLSITVVAFIFPIHERVWRDRRGSRRCAGHQIAA